MKSKEKKGSVLLLTLIITMIVLTSVVVLGSLIIGSLNRSQLQSNSLLAFYTAESIIERSLFDYRKNILKPTEVETFIDNLCSSGLASSFPGIHTDVSLDCSAVIEFQNRKDFGTIAKNESVQFQVTNIDGTSKASGVDELRFKCGGSGSWLEVTRVLLLETAGGSDWGVNPAETKKALFSCSSTSPSSYTVDIDESSSYLVSVKALYANASNASVTAYDTSGLQKSFGDFFKLNISADFSQFSRRNIHVEVPGRSIASPLFDFVIYSEKDIIKGAISSPTS